MSGIMEPFLAKERKAQRPHSQVQYAFIAAAHMQANGDDKLARCDHCLEWYYKTISASVFMKTK